MMIAAILHGTVPLFTLVFAHFFVMDDQVTSANHIGFPGIAIVGGRCEGNNP